MRDCVFRGKFFTRSMYKFDQLYPQWSQFAALRQALDPHRLFCNAFIDSLFPAHRDGVVEIDMSVPHTPTGDAAMVTTRVLSKL